MSTEKLPASLSEKDLAAGSDASVQVHDAVFYADEEHHRVFVGERAENGATTYQDADGAPVEVHSPLGYSVGTWTALFLNVSMIIGTGIFSTPSNILKSTGSIGLSLVYWALGCLLTLAGLSVYLELTSYFPSRSGAEVVYLEQAYPRPRFFFPVAFAVQTIILSFTSGNAIVLATWIFRVAGRKGGDWETKGVAIGAFALIALVPIVSTRASLGLVNALGVVKLATLAFIALAGFVVLGGHTSIADPGANFRGAFAGTSDDAYGLSNALVSIIYSYGGFQNVCNLANEVKDPIRTMQRASFSAVFVVTVLYLLVNVAYFAVIPKAEIAASAQVTATTFFVKLFGERAARGLTILPVFSAIGNILAVIVGQARVIREIGRQGVLPFNRWWVNTAPFGTPVGPVATIWIVTTIMILAPPAGDAFNFVVALQNYPDSAFLALITLGLFLIRRQRAKLNLPRSEYRAWTASVLLYLASKVYLLVMPWIPPREGVNATSFHFFYATPSIVGLLLIGVSGGYFWVWGVVLPKYRKYAIRQRVTTWPDGAVGHQIVKIPLAEVEAWDATHDPAGRSLRAPSIAGSDEKAV